MSDTSFLSAVRLMKRSFPRIGEVDERAALAGMGRSEAIPFLVHHNTVPVLEELVVGGLRPGKAGLSCDFTVGVVMDAVSAAAAEWLDLGMDGRFLDLAKAAVSRAISDGRYLCASMVSLDAEAFGSSGERGGPTVLDMVSSRIERSFAAGVARSLRGNVGYYDAELDAVVRRPRSARRVTVVREMGDLSDIGYAADVRRREEAVLHRTSPVGSRKFSDWIVTGRARVRTRKRWRLVGANPTWERYFRTDGVVSANPARRGRSRSGDRPFDIAVNKEFVPELSDRCSGCTYRCACSTWTASGARFFTRGLHGAWNCKMGGRNG